MDKKNLTYFEGLYVLILVIALVLRIVFAGTWSLSEKEAQTVNSAIVNPTTLYQLWTGALFTLFNQTELLARLLPVLLGSAMVLLPLYLRKSIGDGVTLLVAAGIALDPGLIAISKQAGSEIVAICALFALFLFVSQKKWTWVGVSLGVGLLSGPFYWLGLLGFLLCFAVGFLFPHTETEDINDSDYAVVIVARLKKIEWKPFLTGLLVFLVMGGTFFLTRPKMLAAIPGGLLEFFQRQTPDLVVLPISNAMLGFLLAYFAVIIIGIFGIRYLSKPWRKMFVLWSIIMFLLAVAYPGRQLADFIWCVLPLYVPAALQLTRIKLRSSENRLWIGSITAVLSIFLAYFLYSLMQYIQHAGTVVEDSQVNLYLLSALAAFVIFIMILVILAWSWSLYISLDVITILGVGMMLFSFVFSAMKSSGFDAKPDQLMWIQTSYFKDADIFNITMKHLDEDRAEKDHPLIVEVDGLTSESLLWELRNYDVYVRDVKKLADTIQPDVVIAPSTLMPNVSEKFSGQDFIYMEFPAWSLMSSIKEWTDWALYQQPLYNQAQIIVWASLFQGSLEVTPDS